MDMVNNKIQDRITQIENFFLNMLMHIDNNNRTWAERRMRVLIRGLRHDLIQKETCKIFYNRLPDELIRKILEYL